MPLPRLSFEQAKAQYVHRFTMEFIPKWSQEPMPNGKYPAPAYRTDREWYDNTIFPGEKGNENARYYCYSNNQSYPLGKTLDAPYSRG
jgi:hypothetical protein